ncbi:DUF2163 domain-containing protein [Hyphomicrobiales bacterium 4NK60-0047b]
MRSLPTDLETHLISGTTTLCNCWKLRRNDGTIKGFTDHDNNLEFDGVLYEAASGFVGSEAVSRVGLSVDNMEIHSALSSSALKETDLANGLYDNAEIEVYLVNWANPVQRVLQRVGNVGEVKRGSLSFMAEVRGLAHNLQQPQGRIFQQTCDAEIGDNRCTVDLDASAFSMTSVVADIQTPQTFTSSDLASYSTNWFNGGKVEWITGDNIGTKSEVKGHIRQSENLSIVSLWQKLGSPIQAGDQFKITAGCDKTFATCKSKFSNQNNFRGFPHIPGNDFIIKSPNQDDSSQDGSSQN